MRIKYLDVLKTVAIIGVIVIHSAAPLVDNYSVGSYNWWVGNIYDSITRTSVPLFFMVSGALLLDKKISSLNFFYVKKVLPLFFAFLFWSTIYFLQRNIPYPESFTFSNYIKTMLTGTVFGRLWFLYTIIGLYLVTPFVSIFVKNASENMIKGYIVLWFISTTVIDFFQYFYDITIAFDLSLMYGYIGYFVLGYYCKEKDFKINTSIIILFLSVLNLITIMGTYHLSSINNQNVLYFYNNLSPNTILITLLFFVLMKNTVNGESTNNLKEISMNSLGIYLLHSLIMNYLREIGINHTLWNPIIEVPILVVLTFIISFLLSKSIKKIPILKLTLP